MATVDAPAVSAEDVEMASMITGAAQVNPKPPARRHNASSASSRNVPAVRQPQNGQAAETGSTVPKRRGRPPKVQANQDEGSKEPSSGRLKMPSKRVGQRAEAAAAKVVTEDETFDVPDDSTNSNVKLAKPTGSRKQPQRNVATTAASGAQASTDAAAALDSKKRKLNNQIQQRKSSAIAEHEMSLQEAGETSTDLAEAIATHGGTDQPEVPETQGPSAKTLRNRRTDKAPVSADDEPADSIEQSDAHQEALGGAAAGDVDFDPDFQPTVTHHDPNLLGSEATADNRDFEEGDVSEGRALGRNGNAKTRKSYKKQKQKHPYVTDTATGSPVPSEGDATHLELFGRWRDWDTVLDGARSVGVSNLKGKSVKEVPNLATNQIKGLVGIIKDATNLYQQLESSLESEMSDEDIQNSEDRLAHINQEIIEEVQSLSEEDAGDKSGAYIQDIYAHAMPNLVYWLKAALRCRSFQYSQEEDIATLQEVIRLQDLILELCQTAKNWKAKPLTDRPITNSTSQKITPYMRDIRRAFQQELERREQALRQQTDHDALARSHAHRRERLEAQKLMNGLNKAKQRNKIIANLRQHPSPYRTRALPSQTFPGAPSSSYRPAPVTSTSDQWTNNPNQWTEEEDKELVYQLMCADIRYLPAQERYLQMLTMPLLQNKLPQHIRERALYRKQDMLQVLGPQDFVLNIE